MTENLAGRGEGLAGLVAKWREQPSHQDTMPLSKEARAVVFARGLCAKELETALKAAAPAGTADAHFADARLKAGDEVWVRGELSEAIEDGDKTWIEVIFDSATGFQFVSMKYKDVRLPSSAPGGEQKQEEGV